MRRLLVSIAVSGAMIFGTLIAGMLGYHFVAGFEWIDALHNASMILGGMGPVDPVHTVAAKLFASIYALFCGLVFVGAMGLVISPILHRMVHRFHLDEEEAERAAKKEEQP